MANAAGLDPVVERLVGSTPTGSTTPHGGRGDCWLVAPGCDPGVSKRGASVRFRSITPTCRNRPTARTAGLGPANEGSSPSSGSSTQPLAPVAQLEERWVSTPHVAGSTPARGSLASVAQWKSGALIRRSAQVQTVRFALYSSSASPNVAPSDGLSTGAGGATLIARHR